MNASKEISSGTNARTVKLDMKVKLSILWIFVMFNMAFADIVGFMNPGALQEIMAGELGFQVTQQILLVFAVILEIPIAMILLSRVLRYKANRLLNIIAPVITILFVVGGGSLVLSYIFFAAVEVISLLVIIWSAWKWTDAEA